jgi:putative transposase
MLLEFMTEPDPLYAMLEWLTNELMKLEAENKVGAHKGEHCPTRTTHFSGTRVRRFDTRLGTIYLLVPKLRKGGYIPFFVTKKETLGTSPPERWFKKPLSMVFPPERWSALLKA